MGYDPVKDSVLVLSKGKNAAVVLTGIIGTISSASVALLLLHLFAVSFISKRINANKDERIFLRMHLGAFVVCLLLSDLIQGISGIFQLVWAAKGRVEAGPLCTAQAVMILFGDNGTAFWNAVIGIHTFWTVVLGKRMSTVAVAFIIASGWTLGVILAVVGPLAIQSEERGPFYSIAGGWCFVTSYYKDERIYLHYVPMLISAFIITVLYLLVALVLFGILVVDGAKWRLRAPPQGFGGGIRNFFGQFSWGRLVRPSQPSGATHSHSQSLSSSGNGGGIKSTIVHSRAQIGSIRLGSVGRRSTDTGIGVSSIHKDSPITVELPADRRPDTGSTTRTVATLERGRSSTSKKIGIKHSLAPSGGAGGGGGNNNNAAHAQTQMSMGPNQVNGRTLQLRALAVKMLWYPIVYLVLILPIAIARVDSRVKVSLNVMLGFMCLLWLMGTANTIIYVCTRRLGPTPWSRRTMSLSRTRSRSAAHTNAAGNNGFGAVKTVDGVTTHHAAAPVQIFVDRQTHRATDDQLLDIGREKGSLSGDSMTGADISAVISPSTLDGGNETTWAGAGIERPRDSKVGFDFGVTTHTPRRSSYGRGTYSSSVPRSPPPPSAVTTLSPLQPTSALSPIQPTSALSPIQPPSTTIDDPQRLSQIYSIPLQPRSSSPPPFSQPSIIPASQYTTMVTSSSSNNITMTTTTVTQFEEPHPYSRAQSPRIEQQSLPPLSSSSNAVRSMSVRSKPPHPAYYFEDDDESLRIGRKSSRSSTTGRAF
ncbi:hypothetical protein FRC14_003716 [Serendipita sp. 396]|nr:hypothetical protein FRC14_003716 [Serendipita sp. 396]